METGYRRVDFVSLPNTPNNYNTTNTCHYNTTNTPNNYNTTNTCHYNNTTNPDAAVDTPKLPSCEVEVRTENAGDAKADKWTNNASHVSETGCITTDSGGDAISHVGVGQTNNGQGRLRDGQDLVPVVILIHVSGTSPQSQASVNKYLKCYRDIYEVHGWPLVQCLNSQATACTTEPAQYKKAVFALFRRLSEVGLNRQPLILHLIGHEALPLYNRMCEFLQDHPRQAQVAGVILDSCPKKPDDFMYKVSKVYPNLFEALMFAARNVKILFRQFFSTVQEIPEYERFCEHSGKWPELFLYSTEDHIVPHPGVEEAISRRHSREVPVETQCWPDSHNIRHVFVHGPEYGRTCLDFVQRCLERVSQES